MPAAGSVPPIEGLIGVWDEPVAGQPPTVIGDRLEVSGWALTSVQGVNPYVSIYLDDDFVQRAPATASRPDVVAALGIDRTGGGWSALIDVADRTWARVEVIAEDGAHRRSLDRRTVKLGKVPETAQAAGSLDLPLDGDAIAGRVVELAGWCRFPGSETDVVEVHVDGHPAGYLRPGDPRPDVLAAAGGWNRTALTSGFRDHVVIPEGLAGRTVEIFVRVRATDGRVWQSAAVTVRVDARPVETIAHPPLGVPDWAARPLAPTGVGKRTRPSIGVLTHSLSLGGGELYLQELLMRLAAADAADFFVVSPADGPLRGELEAAGIDVHITRDYGVHPMYYGGRATEIAALLHARRCTAVLANTVGVFPAVDAALGAGFPVIWAIHESYDLAVWGHLNWGPGGLPPEIDSRMRDALARAETVFEAEATLTLYQRQIPSLRGRCVSYGIDLAAIADYCRRHDRRQIRREMGFSDGQRVFLCMGVFQERKAQLAMVNAFSQVVSAHPTVRLVLVGDHPTSYSAAIHQLVNHGLAESVRILPIQPDIYRWYLAADILVSASDVESLPRSVLEGMAFGLPTLAADVFGLGAVIADGSTGWLCEPRSGVSLLAGFRRVLAVTDDELAEISARCLRQSEEFDGNGYAEEYLRLLVGSGPSTRESE